MGGLDVAAALASALLHAGWNAAVKASPNPAQAMTAQMLLSALLVLPGLLWTGLPHAAAWPWIAASTLMNVVTVSALLRAYELVGFGIAYPVGRAVAVLLVVPLAALMAGDQPGLAALAGVLVIALSLGVLGFDAARDRGISRQAIAWSAWARPISPPSIVTAALFDMFCGLNGRTRSPRLAKARHSPATSTDLPTSEPVPCSISARAIRTRCRAVP